MPILSTKEELKKHTGIADSFVFEDFEPFIEKALNKYTRRYVGELHATLADEASGAGENVKNKARYLLQQAIANFGMYLYLPMGSVIFDGSGISNANSDQRTPIQWQQMNDIKRGFLSSGHEAMDLLLAHLEEHVDVFAEWGESSCYTESKELLINNATTFSKYYNIFESRQTYLALMPSLRQVEDQYLYTLLCPELIKYLKETDVQDIQASVKEYLQKAIVAFTVAKVCDEGIFTVEATGIRIKYDLLSHESVQNIDYGKSASFLSKTVINQTANGEQYIKMAKSLILENLSDFNLCASPVIMNSGSQGWTGYGDKRIFGL